MFCPYCGTKIDDDSRFCTNCGAKVDGAIPDRLNPASQFTQNQSRFGSMADMTWATVKKEAKSPLILAAVICFTLGILLSFTQNPVTRLLDYMERIFGGYLGYDYYDVVDDLWEISGIAGFVSNVMANIPAILYAVGMWITVGSALDREKRKLSTGGLTLIKVIVIISFIFKLIGMVISAVFVLALFMEIAEEFHGINGSAVAVVFVMLAAVAALMIVYYFKLIKTINSICYTVQNGSPLADISGLVIFFCFVGGICGIIMSLFYFPSLVSSAAVLLFGIVLTQYRKKMRFLIDNGRKYVSPEQ